MEKIVYNIINNKTGNYLKTNCELLAIIPAGQILTDQEIKKYYGIDYHHPDYERVKHHRIPKLVFDKCIIPDNQYFRLEKVTEDI